MSDIRFVTLEETLRAHARQINRFGGSPGIRDQGLLESAIAMPRASFGGQYVHDDLIAMAGAYLFHLCKNHAFVDGNKRVAMAVTLYFLRINGHPLDVPDQDLEALVMDVAAGQRSKDQATAQLRQWINPAA